MEDQYSERVPARGQEVFVLEMVNEAPKPEASCIRTKTEPQCQGIVSTALTPPK